MARPGTLETCRKYLYEDVDKIPATYRERVKRVRVGFSTWYEFPTKSRTEVRDLIVKEFGVVPRTAYEDLQIVEALLGNIKNPERAWMRYRVNAMLDEAYRLAEFQDDPKAMTAAADKIGKYNQLDKPEADPLPFDQIVPQPFEPTDDPTVLGLKKDPDIRAKKAAMLEKYMNDIEITDVPYQDITEIDDEDEEDLF